MKITDGKERLLFEQCFEEEEYELMMKCCEFQRNRRPKLIEVKTRLIEIHEMQVLVHIIFPH